MSDNMVGVVENVGGITAPVVTVTDVPPGSKGTEEVTSPKEAEQAGESQDSSVDGSESNQESRKQRGPSKLDTIRELRAKIREQRSYWESEVGGLKSQMDELKSLIASGKQGEKPRKTFYEAPEEVLGETISSHLSDLEKRLLQKIEQRQTVDQETADLKQETSEAIKFIQTQKGVTPEDEEDIAETIRSRPELMYLRPLDRAKYGLLLWKEERGISDRSAAKARASTASGAPPATSGPKTWTESEIRAEMDKFPDNMKLNPEQTKRFEALDAEIRRAYREKRVTK